LSSLTKKLNALMLCYTGGSSSYFVEKMKEEAEKRNLDFLIESHTVSPFPADFSKYDVILVAPQVKHCMRQVQGIVEKYNIPVVPIDFTTFGLCEVGKVLDQTLGLFEKKG